MKNNISLLLIGMILFVTGCDMSEYDLPEPDGRLIGLQVDMIHVSPRTGETLTNAYEDFYRTDETVNLTIRSNKRIARIDVVNSVSGSVLTSQSVNGMEASFNVGVDGLGIPFGQSGVLYFHLYFDDIGEDGFDYPSVKSYRFTVLADIPSVVNFQRIDGSRVELRTTEFNIGGFSEHPQRGIVATFKPGENSYLEVENSPLLNFGDSQNFSISFWINTDHNVSDPAMMGTMNWNSSNNVGWVVAYLRGVLRVAAGDGDGTKVDYRTTEDHSIMGQGWKFVAITFDRNDRSYVYVDAVEAASAPMTPVNIDAGVSVKINQDGTGNYGDKLGADYSAVTFYNYALTASQVTDIFNAGK